MNARQKIMFANDETVDIGVGENGRKETAEKLSEFLASTYTLCMKSLYFHWNVTGSEFHSLHEMFENQYNDLVEASDDLAERVRALGFYAPGSFKAFNRLSAVKDDENLPQCSADMVQQLLDDHEVCSRQARDVMKVAQTCGDEVTVGMVTDRMYKHEEAAWMLRATLN